MTVEELMDKLKEMSSEQTRETFINHGAIPGTLFGDKVGD